MNGGTSTKPLKIHVNLAASGDFSLGGLRVRPSRRQIVFADGAAKSLEPRVMQVLLALAANRPEVVSRDQLMDLCWDGVVVGDDAVNRCILALRHLVRNSDPPPFKIETIPRVGYALVEHEVLQSNNHAPERGPARIERRHLIGTLAVAGLATAGGAIWLAHEAKTSTKSGTAELWYKKAIEAREQGLVELYPQIQSNLRDAVDADPNYAEAWSALAIAYAASTFIEKGNQQVAFAARTRSAARRALQLDPGSLEARAALAMIPSEYGRWAQAQAALHAILAARPEGDHLKWLLRGQLHIH